MKTNKLLACIVLLFTCISTSAQVNAPIYTTYVEACYNIVGLPTAMSGIELRLWVTDDRELCLRLNQFPEAANGRLWFFDKSNESTFLSRTDAPSGWHEFYLGHKTNDRTGFNLLEFKRFSNSYIMDFCLAHLHGNLWVPDSQRPTYLIKLSDNQFAEIRQYIVEQGQRWNCISHWNPSNWLQFND